MVVNTRNRDIGSRIDFRQSGVENGRVATVQRSLFLGRLGRRRDRVRVRLCDFFGPCFLGCVVCRCLFGRNIANVLVYM